MTDNPPHPIFTNVLLRKLDPTDRELLAPHLKPAVFDRGALMQEQGEPIEQVAFPGRGQISLLSRMSTGRSVQTALIGRESALGVAAGLAARRLAPYRAIAHTRCECLAIPAALFQRALDQSLTLRILMGRCYDAQVALICLTAECNAVHQLSQRLSRWLLQACEGEDGDTLHATHEALAEWLGAQRSTVTSIVRDLERENLIESARGRLTVRDRAGLRARACDCHDAARDIQSRYGDWAL